VIDAFFDLADAVITVRSLIRRVWIFHAGTSDLPEGHDQHINPRDVLPSAARSSDHTRPGAPPSAPPGQVERLQIVHDLPVILLNGPHG
jgi:hypothetical protein